MRTGGVWGARSPRATAVLLGLLAASSASAQRPIRGFTPAAAARELTLENSLAGGLSRDSTGAWFRILTAEPHPAGSARNKWLADFMADRFKAFGWDSVVLRRYDVLLPWPEHASVTMVAPVQFGASLREDGYPADPDTYTDQGPTYLGMSASGDVTGELIYANSGNPADYEWLKAQGVDVRGKIGIVRYSNPYSYRGFKALTAERYGLKALLIYSDPSEDGYRRGLTFPDGPWGPASHLQRGSITYDFLAAGDPLTPGWASVEGARRIAAADALSVPKVIMMPLSARDAEPLLRHLTGPVAPTAWQGALPFTYRVGPGASTVRVNVKMDDRIRPIWVVEARIMGKTHPDETVVLGNHRDAWVYGAVDPSSGTATQLELARGLGAMVRQGHRPDRTLVMASWDAEEWHLTGSTEWGEQFADELRRGAVAYLNVDGSTSGSAFGASAVAALNPLVIETARDVTDPATGRPLLDVWAAAEADHTNPVENRLGSGSDYTVFLNHLGLPIVDLAFNGPYGVYHSVYDNYYWMTRFGDPGFRYMTVMADVWGRMALRLANAELHPFDHSGYAGTVARFLEELAKVEGVNAHLDLGPTRAAVDEWRRAAAGFDGRSTLTLGSTDADRSARLDRINAAQRSVERLFVMPEGLPSRPWFRHALYAPKYTYAAMEFPGVRSAVDEGRWDEARNELRRLTERIRAVALALADGGR